MPSNSSEITAFDAELQHTIPNFDGVEGNNGTTATTHGSAYYHFLGSFTLLMMPSHPFVAFEGPIASEKTTHAVLLARKLGVTPLLEELIGVNQMDTDESTVANQ